MKLQPINLHLPERVKNAVGDSMPEMRFALNQGDEDGELELLIMGFVGDFFDELDAHSVVSKLSDRHDSDVGVRINSPGGLAFDGIAIFNALANHGGHVTTTVEGLAGSSAHIISQAGDTRRVARNSTSFLHRASLGAVGNSHVMRDAADFLDKLDDGIIATYAARTGLSEKKLADMMDGSVDGTQMSAQEAIDLGFADEIVELAKNKSQNARNCADPPNGEGEGVEGDWSEPKLSDFGIGDSWEDLGDNTRQSVARHFAFHESLDSFDGLLVPHHFPDSGKPSLEGVRRALAALDREELLEGVDCAVIEAHLRAHLPSSEAGKPLTHFADLFRANERAHEEQVQLARAKARARTRIVEVAISE